MLRGICLIKSKNENTPIPIIMPLELEVTGMWLLSVAVGNLCIPGVFQAWRCPDLAGIFRRGEEAVVGSSGWKRSCKNNQWWNLISCLSESMYAVFVMFCFLVFEKSFLLQLALESM